MESAQNPGNAVFGSFTKAPLCKLSIYGSVGGYLVTAIPVDFLPMLKVNVENIIVKNELWKLPLSKFCITDIKQLFFCIVLIFHFKKFEKRYGSRKFASYVCSVFIITTLMELSLLYTSHKMELGLGDLPNGPLAVIFSLFVPFYMDIPRIVRASILGIPITGKSIAYICGLQASSIAVESFCLSLIGLAAGALYRANFCYMRTHFMIPKVVSTVCRKLFSLFLDPLPRVDHTNYGATVELQHLEQEEHLEQTMLMANIQAQRDQHQVRGGLMRRWFGERDANTPPSEDNILTLTNMGFNRERVEEALRLCSNDLAQATNHLLASNR